MGLVKWAAEQLRASRERARARRFADEENYGEPPTEDTEGAEAFYARRRSASEEQQAPKLDMWEAMYGDNPWFRDMVIRNTGQPAVGSTVEIVDEKA